MAKDEAQNDLSDQIESLTVQIAEKDKQIESLTVQIADLKKAEGQYKPTLIKVVKDGAELEIDASVLGNYKTLGYKVKE